MTICVRAERCLPVSVNMPRVAPHRPIFLSLASRPLHDAFENDGPGNLSRCGPRHDNDHVNFQDIQILPTMDEILAVQRSPYMPKKNIQAPNHLEAGPQRLLDTQFRHLRFDSVEGIRDVSYHAAQQLITQKDTATDDCEPCQETTTGNRYFLYSNVKFEELLSDEKRGIILRLSYKCPQFMRGRGMIRSGRWEEGMLCALLCLESDEKSLSVTFFEVYMTQSTDSMKARDGRGVRAAVQLAFTRPTKQDDVRRILRYAQGVSSGRYILVEFPKLLYAGFYHCLSTLQKMKSTEIAFNQYIAPRNASLAANTTSPNAMSSSTTHVSPPAYCTQPGFLFRVGCLAETDAKFSLSEVQDGSREEFMSFLKQGTTLDDGQAVALRDCLTRELAFTQGPPGTGKTFLGIALTRVLLASRSNMNHKPILVICLTNHALDSFLGALLDVGITKIARIGRGSREEWTKKLELHTLSRKTMVGQNVWDMKNTAVHNAQRLFSELEAGCKGLNAESATGSPSWPTVESYLRLNHPETYEQLTTSNDNPYAHSFAFDYWKGGGDLCNLRKLRIELETCLLGSAANGTSSISTDGLNRALEQITLHTQQQSARAERRNIWKLSLCERAEIMRLWKADIDREDLVRRFAKLQMDHQSAGQAIRKVWHKRDAKCLLGQDVIGLTTTACASSWEMLKTLDLEIVICEEAGEVMEAHTLCSLFPSVQHAIFIGDPQQLRPEVNEQKMSLETATGTHYRLDESLFERCMTPNDPFSRSMPTSHLNIQRRMHPDIADITRLVYPYLEDHTNTCLHPSTSGLAERMFWLDHRMPEADPSAASKSHVNPYEVAMATGMVRYLIRGNAYSLGDIAIITPYNGQLAALHDSLKTTCSVWLSEKDRKALQDEGLLEEPDDDGPRSKDEVNMSDLLRVATVDNFQGEEAKVVILSTVRSVGRAGFLKTMNRINVACSRARDGFYIVGNSNTLGQVPMWRRVIDIFASRGRIGPSLRTCCSRHPAYYRDVHAPHEFDQIRDCDVLCGETRPCGHPCQEHCHPPELHERLPCTRRCEKVHPCGHQCLRRCSETCGPCRYPTEQQVLPCGHPIDIVCSGGLPVCTVLIDATPLPCGHEHTFRCCDKGKLYSCGKQCGETLSCGHPCQGLCADCRASTSGSHKPCSSKCGVDLPGCGHLCDSDCHVGSPCPPCKQPCEGGCAHGRCKNLCSEPCDPCARPHKTCCSHQAQTSLLCSLPSDTLPCCKPCDQGSPFTSSDELDTYFLPLVLGCGHACPSLCGEICPSNGCPQCVSGTANTASVLVCPICRCALDITELDTCISSTYNISKGGIITGFATDRLEGPNLNPIGPDALQGLACACGTPLHAIRRYSILKRLAQAPTTVDLLLAKIGRSLNTFSRRIYHQEKELGDSWPGFRNQIRPNPLAAAHNRALVTSRAADLLRLSDSITEFNSTAMAFERSVSWLQGTIPAALDSIANRSRTIHPTFSLRLNILHRRARNLWIYDCLRVSRYLVGLEDPSLEAQRMGELLRVRVIKECWTGIADCETALQQTEDAPAVEVEIRLQQVQLSHLLGIALTGSGGNAALKEKPLSSVAMAPEPPVQSLTKAMRLCRRFPDTAGRFVGIVTAFQKFGNGNWNKCMSENKDSLASAFPMHTPTCAAPTLAGLPRTCSNETRKLEWAWGEHVVGHLEICERGGHPYSRETMAGFGAGCPECGREVKAKSEVVGWEAEHDKEVVRKAGECLFEDRFLQVMKGK
jgi:AAA domain